jgi:UDP-glucose 4-epimerase
MKARENTVLVTGGAGFIGSELVSQLLAAGQRVVILDNLANGSLDNLTEHPRDRFDFVQGDVRDAALLAELMPKVCRVYHLACLGVRHSLHSPRENHAVNAAGTLTLLDVARRAGIERFVYVSTSEIYGTAQSVPMAENHPARPTTAYGISKLAAESYVRAAIERANFPAVIVRPFNAFGPRCHHEGDSGEVIPRFMLRALAGRPLVVFGDGKQTRDFTYVTDTARGILMAGMVDAAVGGTFNLGSGIEHNLLDVAMAVARAAGVPVPTVIHEPARPGDARRLLADSTQARQVLGFQPRVSFEEGLQCLVAWYRKLGISPETLLEREVLRNWEPVLAQSVAVS